MRSSNCQVSILINGKRPVTEFNHEGQTFIEGRPGSEFEISISNNTAKRVMAVISVDGLSVINGGTASPDSPGYVVNAHQTITIPGWKLSNNEAAKFTFSGRKDSYAQLSSGNAKNCGVIGVMVWSEKTVDYLKSYKDTVQKSGTPYTQTPWYGQNIAGGATYNSPTYGTINTSSPMLGGAVGSVGQMSIASASASASASSGATRRITTTTLASASPQIASATSLNNLGTEFGAATEFQTVSSTFEKDAIIDTVIMYYDDARGLKARGIVLESVSRSRYLSNPEAFPGMSCNPPKNWTGS